MKGKKFVVVLTLEPVQAHCGKTYEYWMADNMWPDLERTIADNCASLAGKDFWNQKTVHAIKRTATVCNLSVV